MDSAILDQGKSVGRMYGISAMHLLPMSWHPAAILWGVIAVVIDSIKRCVFKVGWPHIGYEVFDRFEPSGANYNASASVPFIGTAFRLIASFNHPVVTAIRDCPTQSMNWGASYF